MGINPKPTESLQTDPASITLEETKALLKKIESLVNIGHWEVDLTTGNTSWSEQLYMIKGLDPRSTHPSMDVIFSVIHPEDKADSTELYQNFIEKGGHYKIAYRIIRPNGDIRHVVSEGTVDLGTDGQALRLFGVIRDVTDENQKEQELQRSNLQLENILNTTQDLIFLADENGYFLKISQSCEKILGYTQSELLGKSFRNLIHPDDFQATVEIRKQIMEGKPSSDFQNRYFKKDGSIIHLNWSATLDQTTNTVFAVARDITQLLKTRESLRLDRQKLAIILNSSPETIWALDRNYNLITANNQFLSVMNELGNWDIKPGDNLVFNTPFPDDFIQEWKIWYDRALAGETFSVVRKITLLKKGGFQEISFKPIYEDGKLLAVGCYSLDISLQKEEELRTQELVKRLNLAQKIGKLGYWEFDIQTEIIYWSDEVYQIWGIDKSRFSPNFELFFNTIHPEDQANFLVHHNNALAGIAALDVVHRILLPSGEIKYVHEKGGLEPDPESGIIRFRGTVQDITIEKTFEKELLARNEFIETTLTNLPLGISVNKLSTGEATYINPAFCQIYGWPPEVFRDGETFFTKIFPNNEYREFITQQILSDIQSGDPERMIWKNIPIATENGTDRIISAKNIPLPEQDLMISTVIDETDRYWAEHSLRTSNERFHLATQAVSDAIWDWDIKKNSIFWGKGYHRLFGYPEDMEQVSEDLWQTKIHPEDLPEIWNSILEARNNQLVMRWTGEYRFMKFDGSYAVVKENTVILRNSDGKPVRMVGALQDISLDKERENHLKLLESVVTNTRDGILITEAEPGPIGYKIIYSNDHFLKMTGYSLEEIIGKSPSMFQGPLTDRKVLVKLKQDLNEWKASTVELINYKKDGTPYWVNFSLTPVADQKGYFTHWIAVERDISEQKKNEAALLYKTRLIATIADIIQTLLENNDWESSVPELLGKMGEVIEVDRVYLFKNFTDPDTGNLFSQQIEEWTNGKVSSEIDNLDLKAIPLAEHPEFLKMALARQPFAFRTKDTQGATRLILENQQIKSILLIPIFVEGKFHGSMGFDDCTQEREWSEDEIGFLTSVTTNLAFAIERKKNLDKIREAFETRNELLESIGDSFYALDKNYLVTYWNNVVEKLTGVKREDIIGKNIWDFVEITNDQFKMAYRKAFQENKAQYFETYDPWVKAWLEVMIYPANGGLSAIVKDITDRKNTENLLAESNERFTILSDATNDAIWDWNIETDEHFWGDGFSKLFGIDTELEGQSPEFWRKRVHPDDFKTVQSILNQLLHQRDENYFESEYRFKRQDGTYAYVVDKASVIRNKDGNPIRIVGAMMDITHRKMYEESLKKLNEELANSNRELEISNKELEQFAYVASHDLQEPLRMISSFLGLIEKKYRNQLDEKGLEYIHFAVDGAKRMREIILDLLEFSKVGNYSEAKKPVNTNELIQEVLLLNKKLIQETDATISVEPLPDIFGHSSSIIQLFQNLISNGLKYQQNGEKPQIWITGKEHANEWEFSVRDNGIGIDPEFREKIFVIFQRLHQKDQFSGSGIGLAICKKIVEFHGGKIWVESSLGQGSTFIFTINKLTN
ncbi:MAG TPA: PAS domain-containing protein [Algoriphagus sp.]|nr:PAS domain-containing protein [Algoriphagus sp.]